MNVNLIRFLVPRVAGGRVWNKGYARQVFDAGKRGGILTDDNEVTYGARPETLGRLRRKARRFANAMRRAQGPKDSRAR